LIRKKYHRDDSSTKEEAGPELRRAIATVPHTPASSEEAVFRSGKPKKGEEGGIAAAKYAVSLPLQPLEFSIFWHSKLKKHWHTIAMSVSD
jgi:hypothetical protein